MGKGEIDKLEFMGLEFASLYGEYLEFAETKRVYHIFDRVTGGI